MPATNRLKFSQTASHLCITIIRSPRRAASADAAMIERMNKREDLSSWCLGLAERHTKFHEELERRRRELKSTDTHLPLKKRHSLLDAACLSRRQTRCEQRRSDIRHHDVIDQRRLLDARPPCR